MSAVWETVIGLEVHAHLLTRTKLFCRCSTTFGGEPNAHTCEVCLGMPGALPVLNQHAVELALKAALALGCEIQPRSEWSRKQYFYPDLSKGYQISQFDQPYALNGELRFFGSTAGADGVHLQRIHMEEDAGKSIHASGDYSLVDYNRASVPLVEIVSHPDLRTAEDAAAYLKALREILVELEVCDGNMEEGSFRCDANVSIRHPGEALGTRVELKNINSFKFVVQAIHYEVARQKEVLESGGKLTQETRLWDANAKVTRSMRSKEEANDYRYFPDPDLPPLVLDEPWIANLRAALPELPAQRRTRYVAMGLSEYDAGVLSESRHIAKSFEATVAAGIEPKPAANFFMNVVLADLPSGAMPDVAGLLAQVRDGAISLNVAKSDVWPAMRASGKSAAAIIQEKGLMQVSDSGAIEAACREVVEANPDSVASYRAGKTQLFGFFVGQVMKRSGGKLNPQAVSEALKQLLAPK
jgi:aspartyl-tRNA(Asn)/glutamyl-tRNA(Gln) amidotransferase subunit B